MSTIADQIRQFIIETFFFGEGDIMLSDDASLLQNTIIDSTGILELMMFVEQEFGIVVADEDAVPENFDSVNNLSAYIQAKLAAVAA